MYVIKEMKLNKFRPHPIVCNRSLFISKGECPATMQSKDTAECYKDPSVLGATKLKALALAQDIIDKSEEFKHNNGNAAKLNTNAVDK